MQIFRYTNGNKKMMSGHLLGLGYGLFVGIATVVMIILMAALEAPEVIFAIYLVLVIFGIFPLLFLWLKHSQRVATVYVLDEDNTLWHLFIQSKSNSHLTPGISLRMVAFYHDYQRSKEQETINQDDQFILGVVLALKEDPQTKKHPYFSNSIIKKMKDPRVIASNPEAFTIAYEDEKGRTKKTAVYHAYAGMQEALQ